MDPLNLNPTTHSPYRRNWRLKTTEPRLSDMIARTTSAAAPPGF
jgi:hypothetical protein